MSLRFPNLVIAGTVKAGTTSLFSYLARHPDICGSSVKETCYFLPVRYEEELEPVEKYRSYFRHCGKERYVLEATPGYFEGGKELAEALKTMVGDARILIVLRDPVDRLVSFFRYHKAQVNLPKELTLEEYVIQCSRMPFQERRKRANDPYWGKDGGIYASYLEDWFEVFGSDNMRIVFFESLRDDPSGVMRELCLWLDIDADVYESMNFSVENKTVPYRFALPHRLALRANSAMESFLRRHPDLKALLRGLYYRFNAKEEAKELSPAVEEQLKAFYAASNQQVGLILKKYGYRSLPLWLTGEGEEADR